MFTPKPILNGCQIEHNDKAEKKVTGSKWNTEEEGKSHGRVLWSFSGPPVFSFSHFSFSILVLFPQSLKSFSRQHASLPQEGLIPQLDNCTPVANLPRCTLTRLSLGAPAQFTPPFSFVLSAVQMTDSFPEWQSPPFSIIYRQRLEAITRQTSVCQATTFYLGLLSTAP